MFFFYRVPKDYKNGLNVSTSKNGLNVSYTLDVCFGKINIPLLGKRKNCAGPTMEVGSFLNTSEFSWFNL